MFFFFQAEDGIRDLVRSRGLGDVYKRQILGPTPKATKKPVALLEGGFSAKPIVEKMRSVINLSLIHI